ncbi:MAG: hypothetical protein M3Y32_03960 [Pseudomonadota bacterium]|nr:hypothetical protein [Pseudomonadota bacterium]
MRKSLLALALVLLPVYAGSQIDSHDAIKQEKRVLEQALQNQVAECQTRFVVSDCVEQARRQHRIAIKPLQDREMRLDDAERQRRADARRQSLDEKARLAAEQPAPAPPTDLHLRQSPNLSSSTRGTPAASKAASMPAVDPAALEAARGAAEKRAALDAAAAARARATERARAAAAAQARVEAAQLRAAEQLETQARVARKQAERAARGKSSAPLPIPSGAASSAIAQPPPPGGR